MAGGHDYQTMNYGSPPLVFQFNPLVVVSGFQLLLDCVGHTVMLWT